MRYFLEIAYKGTAYSGWQIQANSNSVQAEINKALSTYLSENIKSTGCGRTDAGVHARQFYLHFDTVKSLDENTVYKLNQILPHDISVKRWIAVEAEAHSRYDARERTYEYYVYFSKDPFLKEHAFYYYYPQPDFKLMNEAAALLKDFSDFKSFCKTGHDSSTTLCHVKFAKWEKTEDGKQWKFRIKADRFLRGMVRLIVGVSFMVGTGKLSIEEFEETLRTRGRFKRIADAPAQGLYLTSVHYLFIKK